MKDLLELFVEKRAWFATQDNEERVRHLRMAWEGLFFMMWHADKTSYQRDVCQKVSSIMRHLEPEHKVQWFDEFLYIFNKHWNKIDNFRLDKFLVLVRMQVSELLVFLTAHPEYIQSWYTEKMVAYFLAIYVDG